MRHAPFGMGTYRKGTAGMVGMRHQAALRLHPEAPSSLLGHQQRPWTAMEEAGQARAWQAR
jgi:hypothetical protein